MTIYFCPLTGALPYVGSGGKDSIINSLFVKTVKRPKSKKSTKRFCQVASGVVGGGGDIDTCGSTSRMS